MDTSDTDTSLLNTLPTRTLGYPLGKTLKIIVYLLLPPIFLGTVYLNLIISDIALIILHMKEDNPRWATSTLLIIWWPAVASFIFTVASPTLWPGNTALDKENFKFLGMQLLRFTFFAFGVCYRYVHRIFWAIEAMFASLRRDVIRMEEAVNILLKPNTMELYFFLQAYLHCAPQIILQFYIILRVYKPYSELVNVQLLSVAANLLQMAIVTTQYQRFERRKVLGVEYPWSLYRKKLMLRYSEVPFRQKVTKPELISNFVGIDLNRYSAASTVRLSSLEPNQRESDDCNNSMTKRPLSSIMEHEAEGHRVNSSTDDEEFYNDDVFYGVTNSPPPEYRENVVVDDEDEIRRADDDPEITNSEEVERRQKNSVVVDMSMHVTPPDTHAPRFSFHVIKDRIVSNAEMIIDKIPQRTYKDNQEIQLPIDQIPPRVFKEVPMPVRIRQKVIKGIAQEDGVAKFIAFISWWLFIIARMLAVATFSYFYFEISVYICIAHYLLMLLVLMCNSWNESIYRKLFYLFLSYIYLFCIIEFKMKFRKVRLWYGLYFALVSSENFLMLAVWFWGSSWDTWWFSYIGVAIILSSALSYMSFFTYFLMLKPRPMTVYPLMSQLSCSPAVIN